MKILYAILFAVGLACGVTAMGCWVLTQADAGITKAEGPMTIFVMSLASVTFVLVHAASAILAKKREGARAVLSRMLFLMGFCGVLVVLFFVATSVGRIFLFGPLPTALLLVSISCVLAFRQKRIATAS
jgi:hypothetical protein